MIGGIPTILGAICIVLHSEMFNTIIQMIETKTAGIYTLENLFLKYSANVKLFLLKLIVKP
jgi:energy-converting hydrogenase Eha subunit C